ncbi:MAG: ABC transporter substrate-binding protein [Bacteroidota bacterium]
MRLLLILSLTFVLAACQSATDPALPGGGTPPDSASSSTVQTDADAYQAVADSALASLGPDVDPSQIVSLGGPITETVYALGMGENVIGADQSSLYPEGVLEKPRLNYFRQTSAEGVLSLAPTLVLASDETGPPEVLDQIRSAGTPVLAIPSPETIAEAEARIALIGRVLGREAEADSLSDRMRRQLAEAESLRPEEAPRALFIYARGAGLVQVLGTGTTADLVLRLAGAENAAGIEGNAPLTAEAVAAAQPDVVVIPARGLESIGGVEGLFAQPGLAQTPAGASQRVVAVDDALLLGLGPRVGEGVIELARGLSASPVAEAQ